MIKLAILNRTAKAANYLAILHPHDETSPVGGGCAGQAAREITGVYAAQSDLNLEFMALHKAIRSDPRIIEAEVRWSMCMQKHGFTYANTTELLGAIDQAAGEGRLTPQFEAEHQRAVKQAKLCGNQERLEVTITLIRKDREATFVATHRERLAQHLARLRVEEAIVRDLLDE
jgi:hypothetical protein